MALIAVLTGDIVGSRKLPSALGFLYLVFSVPIMTGSLIAGMYFFTLNFQDPKKEKERRIPNFYLMPVRDTGDSRWGGGDRTLDPLVIQP